jgi:hypothetical protein
MVSCVRLLYRYCVDLRTGIRGGMTYSNNAENIYSFRITCVGPLHIPLVLRLGGPFRYDFLVGPLQGHVYPNSPRVHVEKVSFRPRKILRSALSVLLFGEARVTSLSPSALFSGAS